MGWARRVERLSLLSLAISIAASIHEFPTYNTPIALFGLYTSTTREHRHVLIAILTLALSVFGDFAWFFITSTNSWGRTWTLVNAVAKLVAMYSASQMYLDLGGDWDVVGALKGEPGAPTAGYTRETVGTFNRPEPHTAAEDGFEEVGGDDATGTYQTAGPVV